MSTCRHLKWKMLKMSMKCKLKRSRGGEAEATLFVAGKWSQMECSCDFELDNQESGQENPMPLSTTGMEE